MICTPFLGEIISCMSKDPEDAEVIVRWRATSRLPGNVPVVTATREQIKNAFAVAFPKIGAMEAADVQLSALNQSQFGTWKRFIRKYVKQLIRGGLLTADIPVHKRAFTNRKESRALADRAWPSNDEVNNQ